MDEGFSGVVRISNISDFIAPNLNCIIPLEENTVKQPIQSEVVLRIKESIPTAKTDKNAIKISLNDCLACNGCITSAETVLVQEQSLDKLLEGIVDKALSVVTVSPQSVVSIAAKRGLSPSSAAQLISAFFLSKGVTHIVDSSFGRYLSLLYSYDEFLTSKERRPLLASACPGFVCYAEKTHGKLLPPLISRVRSPQAIHGALIKDYLAKMNNLSACSIFHATVMPCFDKKLEASREDFLVPGTSYRETDCVISSGELEAALETSPELQLNMEALPQGWLGNFGRGQLIGNPGTTSSGGYADFIAEKLAVSNSLELRTAQMQKNLVVTEIGPPGNVQLRIARIYGFRNIQNLVRKLKTGKATYDYVEVMACPGGCGNGGGQVRGETSEERDAALKIVEQLYSQLAYNDEAELKRVAAEWSSLNPSWKSLIFTDYHAVDTNVRQQLAW